ncbi:YciI family protein [uncultured Roseobacter sp.]|uniref:YciI family protein n=1 Tax=uncultured Roseobacter sp. TaxID=114847 RepID=UPI00261C7DCE|nr:YciI family protein [uncultured Roseobacter sp.]
MHFVVHALDKPDALSRRHAVLAAHRTYLDQAPARHGVRVLLSGPLTSDDGARMIGSFFLLEAPDRKAIDAMFAADPMANADVWELRHLQAVTLRQNAMSGTDQSV